MQWASMAKFITQGKSDKKNQRKSFLVFFFLIQGRKINERETKENSHSP
jgi:hypothetical protein